MITSYDIESKTTFVPFYRVYTPRTLRSKAEFFDTYSFTATALTFSSGGMLLGRMFKLPLLPKGVFTSNYADVTVKITVGLDNTVRNSRDSDPKFILSSGYDNTSFGMGFELRDENGLHCRGIQGIVGTTLHSKKIFTIERTISRVLPEEFTMIINPSERWGTCYHASDTGVISLVSYTCSSLALTNGLYLEVYREGAGEYYIFNYIIVEIHQN